MIDKPRKDKLDSPPQTTVEKTRSPEAATAADTSCSTSAASTDRGVIGSAPIPLSIAHLRESQDFTEMLDVRKPLTTVKVRRPGKTTWFRAHPDPDYRITGVVFEDREGDGEGWYLIAPELRPHLRQFEEEGIFKRVEILTCVTRQHTPFLFPIRFPSEWRKRDSWALSAREAAERTKRGEGSR